MSPQVALADRSPDQLQSFLEAQQKAYAEAQQRGLGLNLTRGKPASAQLNLANELLSLPQQATTPGGVDTRNYGGLEGIAELRKIFAELLGVGAEQLVAGGNSSLMMMRDVLTYLWLKGGVEGAGPWGAHESVKFICPVPGYDRHFALMEWLGVEMVTVPMNENGPDMTLVRSLVADDPSVKGIWLVPTYSNPTGATVTQEIAAELASMPTAAPDFKILWDNAYALHHLTEDETKSADIWALCSASGHPHRPIAFASTSKITFAGAGVAFMAASPENIAWYTKNLGFGSIGPDKVNQLRHLEFLGSAEGVREHMRKHADLIRPKFEAVDHALSKELDGLNIAEWTHPTGGYFVNLDVMDGTASRVVELAKQAGIALTPAGASFPLGRDPRDRNIRLAPTFPPLEDVEVAMSVVATCVALAAAEKLTGQAASA